MGDEQVIEVVDENQRELDHLLGVQTPKEPSNMRLRMFGLIFLFVFFGGFALWSYLAPIDSAAVAQGQIMVAGNRRVIQHLEGGIIKKINVRDGDRVLKDQVLVELDNTRSIAALSMTRSELYQQYAIEARLLAERDHTANISFEPVLVKASHTDEKLKDVISSQEAIFKANKKSLDGNIAILNQQISQLREQIKGVKAQYVSNAKQYELISEEVKEVAQLAAKKLVEKPRLLALQRNAAQLQGARGDNVSKIAILNQRIGETKSKILTLESDQHKDVLTQLREVQKQISDLVKREVVEKDVMDRTLIRSPQTGSVVGLQVHTKGGVVSPGAPMMDIVPEEQLVIQARVSPLDIDVVHKGLIAQVTLSAFKSRTTPTLEGRVESVSADAVQDPQTGEPYYEARVQLDNEQLALLDADQELYPGMPVQVMIVTDKRTMFQYLTSPITDSFNRAFREQ